MVDCCPICDQTFDSRKLVKKHIDVEYCRTNEKISSIEL